MPNGDAIQVNPLNITQQCKIGFESIDLID